MSRLISASTSAMSSRASRTSCEHIAPRRRSSLPAHALDLVLDVDKWLHARQDANIVADTSRLDLRAFVESVFDSVRPYATQCDTHPRMRVTLC
jgi:hypothetical protein